jgi:hypothetical protein
MFTWIARTTGSVGLAAIKNWIDRFGIILYDRRFQMPIIALQRSACAQKTSESVATTFQRGYESSQQHHADNAA